MAITFPLLTGWTEPFTTAPARTKSVGTGANRKAYALVGQGDADLTPSGFTVGGDALSAIGAQFSDAGARKWRLYGGDLTVSGSQTCTPTFSGGAGDAGAAFVALIVIQGDAALTVDGVLALAGFITDGGGGSDPSATVTTTTGDTAVFFSANINTGSATATGGGTQITSDTPAYGTAVQKTAAGASTTLGLDFGAFQEGTFTGFAVREASGPATPSVCVTALL